MSKKNDLAFGATP